MKLVIFFKFSKLSMIVSVLIVATISLSMNNIIAFDKNSYFILLQRLVLIIYPKKKNLFHFLKDTNRQNTIKCTEHTWPTGDVLLC